MVMQAARQAVKQTKFKFWQLKKFFIQSPVSVFLFSMLYFMLILFRKGDTGHVMFL